MPHFEYLLISCAMQAAVRTRFALDDVQAAYPVRYEQSMNTVLVQEVIRYNRLLKALQSSLQDLLRALKGLVVLSSELEQMMSCIFDNKVPLPWASRAYPSLKPLAAWVLDLRRRLDFIQDWIAHGPPPFIWISGFFFPQAFLTGQLQNYARAHVVSIDSVSFGFRVLDDITSETRETIRDAPAEGCYIDGLFLEGARWDGTSGHVLAESDPKALFTDMPPIHLQPEANRKQGGAGGGGAGGGRCVYDCPVYKTLTRAGTLSTTGHSTNFVFAIEVPTDLPPAHWVKRAVALICALNY